MRPRKVLSPDLGVGGFRCGLVRFCVTPQSGWHPPRCGFGSSEGTGAVPKTQQPAGKEGEGVSKVQLGLQPGRSLVE